MGRLPPELKHLIASRSNIEDVCSFRRVKKGFDQAAVNYYTHCPTYIPLQAIS